MTYETKVGLQFVGTFWAIVGGICGLIWFFGLVGVLILVVLGISLAAFYIGADLA